MSRYISLDSHTQLEQIIAYDLRSALGKRGFSVIHHGKRDSHAPGGKPDIVVFNEDYVLIFEVTKSKSAAQDREFQPIRSHLKDVKTQNPDKLCFCVFVSPKTSGRTFDSIHDHNHQRAVEGKADMKILPLAFKAFELWLTRLEQSPEDKYPVMDFIGLFDKYPQFTDDARIFDLLVEFVFPHSRDVHEPDVMSGNIKLLDLSRFTDQSNQSKNGLTDLGFMFGSFLDLLVEKCTQDWERLAKSENLSMAQVYVLQEIYFRDTITMSALSEILKITPAAISQLIDKLVLSGWVDRTEYPENRRMKQLALAPKAAAFIEEGNRRQHSRMENLLQNLNEEDRRRAIEMFEIMTRIISDA